MIVPSKKKRKAVVSFIEAASAVSRMEMKERESEVGRRNFKITKIV